MFAIDGVKRKITTLYARSDSVDERKEQRVRCCFFKATTPPSSGDKYLIC